MNNTLKTLVVLGTLGAIVFGAQSALAFGGEGEHRFKGHRGHGNDGLVPVEMREEWRAEKRALYEDLSEDERQALREEWREARQTAREEKRQAFADFTGLNQDELKAAKANGESIGDILTNQGITEAEAETFLTEQANIKVNQIVERHELNAEDAQTLRDRITSFVANILSRWFGT